MLQVEWKVSRFRQVRCKSLPNRRVASLYSILFGYNVAKVLARLLAIRKFPGSILGYIGNQGGLFDERI
jgi:hypothetical protein